MDDAPSQRDRLGRTLVILVALLGATVLIAWVAISEDWGDADGFTDCWPDCSIWQHAVGLTFSVGGLLFVTLALFTVGRAVWRRLRG